MTTKEWVNVTSHLKEFNGEEIPSSQKFIDWDLSDEDSEISFTKRNSLLLLKSRKKINLNSKISKNDNTESNKFKEEQNQLISSKSNDEGSKSPILKVKRSFKNVPCISDITNISYSIRASEITQNSAFEGNSRNIVNSANVFDVSDSKIRPNDCITLEEHSIEEHSQNPLSPILKSRIKKRSITSHDQRTLSCKKKLSRAQESRKKDFSIEEKITESRFIANKVPILCDVFDAGENVSEKRIDHEDLNPCISDCSSPRPSRDLIQKADSLSSLSIDVKSSESSQRFLSDKQNARKGSDWVKDIHNRSPEVQSTSKFHAVPPQAPDSSKKRIKKDGLAAQLRRLLHSWKSNISMWNHQMSLAALNQEITCSSSPHFICSNISPTTKADTQELQLSRKLSSNSNNSSPLYLKGPGRSLKFSSSLKPLNRESREKVSTDPKPFSKFLPEIPPRCCVRNLKNSLEIQSSSESSVELSGKTNFTLPKKHLCVKILKVECETSVMTSAICQEVDDCSRRLGREESPRTKTQRFLGIFGCLEDRPSKRMAMEVGDKVKIFAPWQVLQVKDMSLPALFSSYFIRKKEEAQEHHVRWDEREPKLATLASWECPCSRDSHTIPSTCIGGVLRIRSSIAHEPSHISMLSSKCNGSFSTVRDFPLDSSPKRERYWTVLEAIEQCGSMADIPVSITLRIRRIYPMKTFSCSVPSHYWILGQDPSGVFLLVEVPNRPLKSTLESLLRGNEGRLSTLTHLSVAQRITDTQNSGLFAVINSLQTIYNRSIAEDRQLLPLLGDQLRKSSQSFCYKFIANLGQTLDIKIAEKEAINMALPLWSLEEALELNQSGVRGCVSITILYYIDPYLYVTCAAPRKNPSSTCGVTSRNRLRKITVRNSVWFPSWVQGGGTIMTSALVKDILISHGCLVVDEFSRIEKVKGELSLCLRDVLALVPELGPNSSAQDVVAVGGSIKSVNEEDACSWEECCVCGGRDLYKISSNNTKCQVCGTENISPITKYSLEVGLCLSHSEMDWIRVRVKLFQVTTKNLLKDIPSVFTRYQPESLYGATIGPLVCVVHSVEEKRAFKSILLHELPY